MGTSGPMQLAQVFVSGISISFGNFFVSVSLSHNVPQPCLVAGVVDWRKHPDLVGV